MLMMNCIATPDMIFFHFSVHLSGLCLPPRWHMLIQHEQTNFVRTSTGMESAKWRRKCPLHLLYVHELVICLSRLSAMRYLPLYFLLHSKDLCKNCKLISFHVDGDGLKHRTSVKTLCIALFDLGLGYVRAVCCCFLMP